MIERAVKIVGIDPKKKEVKLHYFPVDQIPEKDPNGKPRKQKYNYRSAVGCLSYIHDMIQPDITMSVQQCARFFNKTLQEHK